MKVSEAGLQITVGHRTMADQTLPMSDEIPIVVGYNVWIIFFIDIRNPSGQTWVIFVIVVVRTKYKLFYRNDYTNAWKKLALYQPFVSF